MLALVAVLAIPAGRARAQQTAPAGQELEGLAAQNHIALAKDGKAMAASDFRVMAEPATGLRAWLHLGSGKLRLAVRVPRGTPGATPDPQGNGAWMTAAGLDGLTPVALKVDSTGALAVGADPGGAIQQCNACTVIGGLNGLQPVALKVGSDGTVATSGSGGSFATLTGGTNTTAAMVCGTGCSIGTSGTGTITATSCTGASCGAAIPTSVDTGVVNASVITTTPAKAADGHTICSQVGDQFLYTPKLANTGAVTVNCNGQGVVSVLGVGVNNSPGPGGINALTGAELAAGGTYLASWDGTNILLFGVRTGVAAANNTNGTQNYFNTGATGGIAGCIVANVTCNAPEFTLVTPYSTTNQTTARNMLNLIGNSSNVGTCYLGGCGFHVGFDFDGYTIVTSDNQMLINTAGQLWLSQTGGLKITSVIQSTGGAPMAYIRNQFSAVDSGPAFQIWNFGGTAKFDIENSGIMEPFAGVGAIPMLQLAAPAAPTVTYSGSAGSTTWSYYVQDTFFDGSYTYSAPSVAGTAGSAKSTLDGSDYNYIQHTCPSGAAYWTVFRSTSNASSSPVWTGRVTPQTAGFNGYQITCSITSVYDIGNAADATAPFAAGTTGQIRIGNANRTSNPILETVSPPTVAAGATSDDGFAFQVVYSTKVTQLGRYCYVADTHAHIINLWQAGNGTALATATVTCASSAQYLMASITAVTLTPGNGYFLTTDELTAGDQFNTAGWNPTSAFIDPDLGLVTNVFGVTGTASTLPTVLTQASQVVGFPQMTMVVASPNAIINGDGSLTFTAHALTKPLVCAAASGSGTAYTCSTSPTFTPAARDVILFHADVASTGAMTLNVNSTSAAPVKDHGGTTAIAANDFLAGQDTLLEFDGTNWQMQGQTGNTTGTGSVVLSTSPTLVTPALGTPSTLVLTNATGLTSAQVLAACTTCTTNASALTSNVLVKGGGGQAAQTSSITDNGTTVTTTDTGGYVAPVLVSNVATGTAPLTITSTTTVPNLTVSNHPKAQFCGTTTTCSHTAETSPQIVYGSAALVSGTPSTAAVTGISPAFTSSSSYVCTVTGQSNATTGLYSVANISSSAFTITGPATTTTVMNYICVGN